jgi:hypothetical protein
VPGPRQTEARIGRGNPVEIIREAVPCALPHNEDVVDRMGDGTYGTLVDASSSIPRVTNGQQRVRVVTLILRFVQTVISLAEMSDRLNTICLFDARSRRFSGGTGRQIEPLTYGMPD